MRNMFAQTFHEAAKLDARLCMIVADISPAGAMNEFRKDFPERFINTGVAEQVMIGMAAGMSMQGLRPFAYTIATFALYRPFEFIRNDLCYQNLPVTVVGIGGGLTYSTLGSTHHAQEDIAVACSVPNLRVIAPCDAEETRYATQWCTHQEFGPVYMRLGKAGEPVLGGLESEPFIFGLLRYLKKGKDIAIIGYGPILRLAFECAEKIEAEGKSCSIISSHTLKPLDCDGLIKMLTSHDAVVVLEEMTPRGGLSDAIRVIAIESNTKSKIRVFTLKDEFIHAYGSHDAILDSHGLTVENMMTEISKLIS